MAGGITGAAVEAVQPEQPAVEEEVQIAEEHVTIKGVATRETEAPKPAPAPAPKATPAPRVEKPAEAVVEKTVSIERVTEGEIRLGDKVTFRAIVEGFTNPQYQWQVSDDHETWEDLEGKTEPECEIEISSTHCFVRVAVTEA